jgi:hypothetical protein
MDVDGMASQGSEKGLVSAQPYRKPAAGWKTLEQSEIEFLVYINARLSRFSSPAVSEHMHLTANRTD